MTPETPDEAVPDAPVRPPLDPWAAAPEPPVAEEPEVVDAPADEPPADEVPEAVLADEPAFVDEPAPVLVEEPAPAFVDEPAPVLVEEPAPAFVEEEPAPAFVEEPVVAAAPVAPVQSNRARKKEGTSFLKELPFLVVIAFVLALIIKHFLVQAFYIPSGSMEQTLQVGDRVLVNKIPYVYRGPHRGEVVVFNGLDNFDEGVTFTPPGNPIAKALRKINSTIGLGAPDEKDYIKRVIGVAGDRVMCCDADGHVVVVPKGGTARSLDEPYLFEDDQSGTRYFCDAVAKGAAASKQTCPPGSLGVLVPEGRLWVMGDHRGNSSDSRFHITDEHQGTVPEDKVVGKAFTVVYPFGHAGLLHVPSTFEKVALPSAPFVLGAVGTLPLALLRRRRSR